VKGALNVTKSRISQSSSPDNPDTASLSNEVDTSFDPDGFTADSPAPSTNGAANPAPDPFDPTRLRLSQDLSTGASVKKVLLSIPLRKPSSTAFVRAHPHESYRLQTKLLVLKDERETYLVMPELWDSLATEPALKPQLLVTAIDRQGVLFVWQANLPRPDGRVDEWTRTMLEAIDLSTKSWVRVTSNMGLGAYEVSTPTASLPDPVWPEMPFSDILRIAFKGKVIDREDHSILRRLRGEV
jgi:hypothetical protein